ncbi:CPBP family intramembrane glutamic endopeptidase [Winogradskyella flava]|uniref:CPBP family intramembrane glutamic endopeptidase n=1 Tax=Winogradskyella flava TaxID=1884876 RepID=UPI002492A9EA|nr:CPBP family intramembrane metalloprotease [Winogradskyella flava]
MAKSKKLRLSLFLFLLGMLGVLSLLTMDISNSIPDNKLHAFENTPEIIIKLSLLVVPAIVLVFGLLIGIFTYDKSQLKLPLIEGLLFRKKIETKISEHLIFGITFGIILAGIVILVSFLFEPFMEDFIEKSKEYNVPLQMRLLYGGITEEIMVRFGVMSLVVFILMKITKKESSTVYILGILISAFLFALAHFPSLYAIESEPSAALLAFVIIGNMIAGIFFGWLYWKKSLTASMIAHMFFHITVVCLTPFITS